MSRIYAIVQFYFASEIVNGNGQTEVSPDKCLLDTILRILKSRHDESKRWAAQKEIVNNIYLVIAELFLKIS